MAMKILRDLEATSSSTPITTQANHEDAGDTTRAPANDILFDMVNPQWDLGDMDMEGLLDPSMPTLFQDIDLAYLHE